MRYTKKSTKKRGKKITIEDLVVMTQKGFTEMTERFEGRFTEITEHFEKRFDKIEQDISETKDKLSSLERRIMFLEDKATEHSKILAEHSRELKEIKDSIKKLQRKKDVESERIFQLEKRVEILEARVGISAAK